jgi:putative heme transporter
VASLFRRSSDRVPSGTGARPAAPAGARPSGADGPGRTDVEDVEELSPAEAEAASHAASGHEDRRIEEVQPISRHPFVRAGIVAWSAVGIALALMGVLYVLGLVRIVVTPLVLALFPAALLAPVHRGLRRARVPAALASLLVLLGGIGLLVLVGFVLVPQVAEEIPRISVQVQEGLEQLQVFLESGPFGLDPAAVTDTIARIQTQIAESEALRTGVVGAAGAVAEITTMLLLLLVVLFFYLKDGERIATWMRSLFPARAQPDAAAIGSRAWNTIGAYFRGQLFVALVDAIFIGIGIWLIGVPLALPLAVLVFFGGLFPIVGAVASGAVAILVALATGGPGLALATLAIVIAVQQIESNILAPLVLGKATELHPLAVITALTIGGILLGVLGAFLAVPVAASLARGVGYLRERHGSGTAPVDVTPA